MTHIDHDTAEKILSNIIEEDILVHVYKYHGHKRINTFQILRLETIVGCLEDLLEVEDIL